MYYFIINPNASGGRGRKVWRQVEKELKKRDVEYQAFLTESQGDAARYAAELTDGWKEPRTIVAVGGDGTIGEVTCGLAFSCPVTLGYIPAGSGNDFARSLRISQKPLKSLKKVLAPGCHKLLDYGVVSYGGQSAHHRFLVSAGIGMDAAVCHKIAEIRSRQDGRSIFYRKWIYLAQGIRQLVRARPVEGWLLIDGVKKVEFSHIYFVSVHIHPYEGGGFLFAPEADPCDGRLDVRVVHQDRKIRLVPILLGAFLGSRKRYPGSRRYACREAEIHLNREMPVHYDGECCGWQQDLQVRCVANRIRMIL